MDTLTWFRRITGGVLIYCVLGFLLAVPTDPTEPFDWLFFAVGPALLGIMILLVIAILYWTFGD